MTIFATATRLITAATRPTRTTRPPLLEPYPIYGTPQLWPAPTRRDLPPPEHRQPAAVHEARLAGRIAEVFVHLEQIEFRYRQLADRIGAMT